MHRITARRFTPHEGPQIAPPREIEIVFLYDDFSAGKDAIQVVAGAFNRLDGAAEFRPRLWRFDLLRDPEWFSSALAESRDADIFVVATRSRTGLNSEVRTWLESRFAQEHQASGALVAMLGPFEDPDRSDSPRFQMLQTLAHDAGFAFLAPAPSSRSFSDWDEPCSMIRCGYWGLNE
jgi:hypothetical protein